jgi:hypothetical protein
MVRVDGALLEGGNSRLDKSGLVERVGMDKALHVQLVADGETRVDGGRGGAPVFVKLEATGAGDDLLAEGCRAAVVAFASDSNVHR